jgi:D-lactate dehydrogenase
MLTLNRNIHRAYNRVREGDFELNGLMGFDMFGKTVGIVGTGKIGAALARIMADLAATFSTSTPITIPRASHWGSSMSILNDSFATQTSCPCTARLRLTPGT